AGLALQRDCRRGTDMVHSSPERDGRTTARTRVPPERQPLRPATALAVLSLLTVLLEVAGAVLVVVAARTGLLEDVVRDMDPEGPGAGAWGGMWGRDGGAPAGTRVRPGRRPLGPATALAVLSLLTVLLEVAGAVLVVVAARTGLLEDVVRDMDPEGPGSVAWIVMLVLGVLGVVVVGFGLRLASVVLGILVVIRGDGKLRIGASLLLAIALFGMFFSLTIEGPALS